MQETKVDLTVGGSSAFFYDGVPIVAQKLSIARFSLLQGETALIEVMHRDQF